MFVLLIASILFSDEEMERSKTIESKAISVSLAFTLECEGNGHNDYFGSLGHARPKEIAGSSHLLPKLTLSQTREF
jgi:hypothetical protein